MIDQEKYQHYVNKFLGFMSPDQRAEVVVTNSGLEYKGNLIVAIKNLKDQLTIKEKVVIEQKVENPVKEVSNTVSIETPEEKPRKRRNTK